jgi:hypothetical protein
MNTGEITVKRWTEDEFHHGKERWQGLLNDSNANTLFLSWNWMHSWWQIWGRDIATELYILAAYSKDELVGIAPLYFHTSPILKGCVTVKRIEFLGTCYRNAHFIRAEYLQFITKPDLQETVNRVLFDYLFSKSGWDEIILSDLTVCSDTYKAINAFADENNCTIRVDCAEETYAITCTDSYSSYISGLGRNTRLKLYNRRKELEKHGPVLVRNVALSELDHSIGRLNKFHEKRWSSLCFSEKAKQFIVNISGNNCQDKNTYCSELLVDGEVVSVLYNLKSGASVYNIQSGFIENFNRKISLGTLHLGYFTEELFKDNSIDTFDLLAGTGKNSNYKARLSKPSTKLETIQVVRSTFLKSMYTVKEKIWDKVIGKSNR